MSPDYARRLRRAIRLFLRELRGGCVECIACRGFCHEHNKVAFDIHLNPRKYVTIPSKRKDSQ